MTEEHRATLESWIVRAQISLADGQPQVARVQLEAALQALYTNAAPGAMTDEQIFALAAPYTELTGDSTVEFYPSNLLKFGRALLAAPIAQPSQAQAAEAVYQVQTGDAWLDMTREQYDHHSKTRPTRIVYTTPTASPVASNEREGLTDLHKELDTIKWIGADEGWDKVIDAVQKRIIEMLAARTGEGA